MSIAQKRKNGNIEALKESGIPFDKSLVKERGLNEKGGYKTMNELLDLTGDKRLRAVVAINDPAAFGAIKAIK